MRVVFIASVYGSSVVADCKVGNFFLCFQINKGIITLTPEGILVKQQMMVLTHRPRQTALVVWAEVKLRESNLRIASELRVDGKEKS